MDEPLGLCRGEPLQPPPLGGKRGPARLEGRRDPIFRGSSRDPPPMTLAKGSVWREGWGTVPDPTPRSPVPEPRGGAQRGGGGRGGDAHGGGAGRDPGDTDSGRRSALRPGARGRAGGARAAAGPSEGASGRRRAPGRPGPPPGPPRRRLQVPPTLPAALGGGAGPGAPRPGLPRTRGARRGAGRGAAGVGVCVLVLLSRGLRAYLPPPPSSRLQLRSGTETPPGGAHRPRAARPALASGRGAPCPPRPPPRPPLLSLPHPRRAPGSPGRGEGTEQGSARRREEPGVAWGPACPAPSRAALEWGAHGSRGQEAPHGPLHMREARASSWPSRPGPRPRRQGPRGRGT